MQMVLPLGIEMNEAAPIKKRPVKTKEIILQSPEIEDIVAAYNELTSIMGKQFIGFIYPHQKVLMKFSEPVRVYLNRRKSKEVTEVKVNLFFSKQGNWCYTLHNSTGFSLHYIDYRKVVSLSIQSKRPEDDELVKIHKVLRHRHPNAWTSLPDRVSSLKGLSTNLVSIKDRFPADVLEEIKDAFENKTEYSYRQKGRNRDLSISCKVCEDGEFRAWYSSEYVDCANGTYYLLINPTTASFGEDD